jgi:hypothetical protein
MLDWNTLRVAYLERFGSLFDAHGSADSAYHVLHFWTPNEPDAPMFYATLGASRGPFAHEVVLAAAASFPPFRQAIESVVRAGSDGSAPLRVVPCMIPGTLFEALFVLPPTDGTFALGDVDGHACHALRVVPVTGAERRHAEDDPIRLLERLRAAGALVADPKRDCLIAPTGRRRRATREEIRATMKALFGTLDQMAGSFRERIADPKPEGAPIGVERPQGRQGAQGKDENPRALAVLTFLAERTTLWFSTLAP